MKKVLSLILLLVMVISVFGLTACEFIQFPNNPNNPDNPDNPDTPGNGDGDNEVTAAYSSFDEKETKFSYIGCGINIIDAPAIEGKYVNDMYSIFDKTKLNQAKVKKSDDTESTFQKIEGLGIVEFSKSMSESDNISSGQSVSAKGQVKGVDAGATASFSNGLKRTFATATSEVESQYFVRIMAENRSYWLYLQEDESKYKEMLSEEFERELYTLSIDKLFSKYGTHVLLNVAMGGNIYLDYTLSSMDKSVTASEYSELAGEYKSTLTASFGKYSGSAESKASYMNVFSQTRTINEKSIKMEDNITCAGPFSGIYNVETFFDNYADWQQSLYEQPVLVGVHSSENSLYPIWELIDSKKDPNGTRKAELIAYFEEYALNSYNELRTFYDRNTIHIGGKVDGKDMDDAIAFEQLKKIADKPDKTYMIHQDINCGGASWEPIKEFTGTIEGNGHKIYNFTILQENDDFAGSAAIGFVGTNKGTIKNLIIGSYDYKQQPHTIQGESGEIETELAGRSVLYLIKYTENNDEKTNSLHVGGIAGINEEKGIINGCKVINANIYSKLNAKKYKIMGFKEYAYLYQGGIAGTNYGEITNSKVHECHIEGKITATIDSYDRNKGWLGGVCGYSTNKIEHCSTAKCYLKLDVRGDGYITTVYPWATVGGIVAEQVNGDLNMCLSYDNTIDVYASEGGRTEPTITAGTIVGKLESCTPMGCCALYPTDSKPITTKTTYTIDSPTYTNNMRGDGKIEGCTAESDKSELHDDIKDLLPDETDN